MSINESKELLIRTRGFTDSIMVGFSGGKDSLVTLDLCCGIFPHVEACFWYLVKGLRCEEIFLQFAEKKYKIPIHRVPSHNMVKLIRSSVYMPPWFATDKIPSIKQIDTENLLRKRTGIQWFAYGMRMLDSIERRAMLKGIKGFDQKSRRVYPIWDWQPREVISYLRQKKIPLPDMFGSKNSGGVGFTPEAINYLREKYPDDLERIKKIFPFLESYLFRERMKHGGNGDQGTKSRETSAIQGFENPSNADQECPIQSEENR